MISKSLTHGISSIATLTFDGEFKVEGGVPRGLESVPQRPGVYVVFDASGSALYVGDSARLQSRWHAGHLNEYRQALRNGGEYKLSRAFEDGCTVRYIVMDSVETAAALEAHLIRAESPPVNSREELLNEQGKRANIEAKKIKDSSGTTVSLATGALSEATANAGWMTFERLGSELIKAIKDELVHVLAGGVMRLVDRVKRVLARVWNLILQIVKAPLQLLNGIVEFVVNALTKAVREIYALARNAFDLVHASWQLFQGAKTMSREQLINKVTETVVISGTLVLWDALDPAIESQLLPLVGPVAPYLSATVCAMGFGISSHYLRSFVPKLVAYLIDFKTGYHESLAAQREACQQLLSNQEQELESLVLLADFVDSTKALMQDMARQRDELETHDAIQRFDIKTLLA